MVNRTGKEMLIIAAPQVTPPISRLHRHSQKTHKDAMFVLGHTIGYFFFSFLKKKKKEHSDLRVL